MIEKSMEIYYQENGSIRNKNEEKKLNEIKVKKTVNHSTEIVKESPMKETEKEPISQVNNLNT